MKLNLPKNVYILLSIAWGAGLLLVATLKSHDVEPMGRAIGVILGSAMIAPALLSSFAMVRKRYRGRGFFEVYWQWNYWFFWLGVVQLLGYTGEYAPAKTLPIGAALLVAYFFQRIIAKRISSSTQ